MNTSLVLTRPAELPEARVVSMLLRTWLSNFSECTRNTYRDSLRDLSRFMGSDTIEDAIARILSAGKGATRALLLAYRGDLAEGRHRAPGTVNVRLNAIQSLIREACALDMIDWTVDVRNLKTRVLKDTAGPGVPKLRQMLALVRQTGDTALRIRNTLILRLMFDMGLRAGEVARLNVEDVDLERSKLWVWGKAAHERAPLSLPKPTLAILRCWLQARGGLVGCLFTRLTNNGRGKRLSRRAVFTMIQDLGKQVGVTCSPHRIRHSAITQACKTDGLLGAQCFARHANPMTTQKYIDNLDNVNGVVARRVAAALDRRTSSRGARSKKRAAATGEHKTRRGGSGGEQP